MSQPSAQVFPAEKQVEVIQFKRRFKVLREMQSSGVGRCERVARSSRCMCTNSKFLKDKNSSNVTLPVKFTFKLKNLDFALKRCN